MENATKATLDGSCGRTMGLLTLKIGVRYIVTESFQTPIEKWYERLSYR